MTIWFTGDTHFCHRNIIDYCDRPYNSVEHMNDSLLRNWNEIVSEEDTIYHLGDFSFNTREGIKILEVLKGRKILIVGNHDHRQIRNCPYWSEVHKKLELNLQGLQLVLSHYPETEVDNEILVHGHAHGVLPKLHNRIDVGVDCWNYKPVRLEDFGGKYDS